MNFLVKGQGVVLFTPLKNSIRPTEESLTNVPVTDLNIAHIWSEDSNIHQYKCKKPIIKLHIHDSANNNSLRFIINDYVKMYWNNDECIDPNNNTGISSHNGAYYWISVDSQNQTIYMGIGEPRLETAIYRYSFPQVYNINLYKKTRTNKLLLESLNTIEYDENTIEIWKILKDPITQNIPLLVKNTDDLSMTDIATGSYLPKSNLSLISQKLYDCISGKKFILNDADFPDFSKAIEHSIKTPGLWCNKTLQKKSTEFDKHHPNLYETYLRITLGQNNGESPGVPYVMEIWPVGHYSPIHNHACANAVIRVLHGNIHVKLFPFLCAERDSVKPFGYADFYEGDITWISPTLNQTHQLYNLSSNKETCITIQCYMYDEENKKHYDYFDYLDGNGNKQQYEPDSDMDFIDFKELMKKEWTNRI